MSARFLRKSVVDAFLAFTTKFEGAVGYMYLDRLGLVTTSIGCLINSPAAAQAFPWTVSGRRATNEEVAAEWQLVHSRQDLAEKGHREFESLTRLRLTPEGVRQTTLARFDAFVKTLAGYYPGLYAWPADAQLGVVSMSWGLGPHFPKTYPRFSAAVNSLTPDFERAAEECSMNGVGVELRNVANRLLFRNAAACLRHHGDRDKLFYPGVFAVAAGVGITGIALLGGAAYAAYHLLLKA